LSSLILHDTKKQHLQQHITQVQLTLKRLTGHLNEEHKINKHNSAKSIEIEAYNIVW